MIQPHLTDTFYSRWRNADAGPAAAEPTGAPPERWLQQLWRHQRVRRSELSTSDGRPLVVVHPGFWNREPGPDFLRAVVRLGDAPARTGDIEIDRNLGGWRAHGHAENPAFSNVILRLVWEAPGRPFDPPVLALKPFLDSPWPELSRWLDEEAAALLPDNLAGRCRGPLGELSAELTRALLEQAALFRLRRKAGELAALARQAGWDAALWSGLFGALGYKHNTWPMRRLAEILHARARREAEPALPSQESAEIWEARLLGLAGMLPHERPKGSPSAKWRRLWDAWWRERDSWGSDALPLSAWRLSGLRPANHPRRRIASAAAWLIRPDLPARCTAWLTQEAAPSSFVRSWTRLICASEPRSSASPDSAALGQSRATDLAVNVALPWLFARAEVGGNASTIGEVERRYLAWPAAEDNAALRLIRQRLYGARRPGKPYTAAHQQGLLQISRDFCDRAGAACDGCRFGEAVAAASRDCPAPSP